MWFLTLIFYCQNYNFIIHFIINFLIWEFAKWMYSSHIIKKRLSEKLYISICKLQNTRLIIKFSYKIKLWNYEIFDCCKTCVPWHIISFIQTTLIARMSLNIWKYMLLFVSTDIINDTTRNRNNYIY